MNYFQKRYEEIGFQDVKPQKVITLFFAGFIRLSLTQIYKDEFNRGDYKKVAAGAEKALSVYISMAFVVILLFA